MKDLRTEIYQLVYEEPIYPKNLYLDGRRSPTPSSASEVIERQIELMLERGIWVDPGRET